MRRVIKNSIVLIALMLCAISSKAINAEPERTSLENELSSVSITMNENAIQVQHAEGQVLHVYNLTGALVATHRVDSEDRSFSHNLTKGCYILKVGKFVRKVSIR